MTTVKFYQNNRNASKFLEIHNDGHYHNSVKQFMFFANGVKNSTDDGCLHRWKISNLKELLNDYTPLEDLNCYEIGAINGHTLKFETYKIVAHSSQDAIDRTYEFLNQMYCGDFDNEIVSVSTTDFF